MNLTTRQMEQIDLYEGQVIDFLEDITGTTIDTDNEKHYELVRELMDDIAERLEDAGIITELELYPYVAHEEVLE